MADQDQSQLTKRILSFRYAFEGWAHVLKTQHNAWIHGAATIVVVILAFWLGISLYEWSILLLTMAFVWTAEFVNTAFEVIVDLISPEEHPLAKKAKDIAAGAVLVSAFTAVIVGLLILGPPLWQRLFNL
jgi:diacylglycerol kinase (ATP)